METDNKYYTPSIDEFHVGFEYEVYASDIKKWVTANNPFGIERLEKFIENKHIRVKYLDTKDLEECGFRSTCTGSLFIYKDYQLFTYEGHFIQISHELLHHTKAIMYSRIFEGIIKNKSELKTLLKWLKITD